MHAAFHNLRSEFDVYKLRESVASHMLNLKLDPDNKIKGPNIVLPSLFINDGRILVTGSINGKVQLWDTIKGMVVVELDHKGK